MEKIEIKTAEKDINQEMTKDQLNYHFYKEYCRLFIAQGIIKKEIGKPKININKEQIINSFYFCRKYN